MEKIFHGIRVPGQIINFSQTYKTFWIPSGILHAFIFKEVLKIFLDFGLKIFMNVSVGNLHVCDLTRSENTVNVDLIPSILTCYL